MEIDPLKSSDASTIPFGVDPEPGDAAQPPRANTTTVLVMLSAAAVTFSYLWAYALTNALVHAGLLSPWQPGRDPRPLRMLVSFVVLTVVFVGIAAVARFNSRRQLNRIDHMADDAA